jgi:adenylate cyclase
MTFVSELKRRKVGRVAIFYLVAGWVAIQVAATLFPLLHLPPAWGSAVAILVLCGFPVAIALAWALDITDRGIERTEALPRRPGRAIAYVALALVSVLAIAGSYVIYSRAHALTAAPPEDLRSIAVLPFNDLSAARDQEYFADGIAEELLNELANIEGLKVAARTSAFAFRGRNQNVAEVARQLGVRMIVEGSVRRDANNLRITAQLIDGKTGFHRWSETYDRRATGIFQVQSEIAAAIAQQLKVRLDPRGVVASGSQSAVEAHDLYLLGLSRWHARTPQSLRDALSYAQRAVDREPKFAEAHALIASTWAVLPLYEQMDLTDAARKARSAAARAFELDRNSAEARAALAHTAMFLEWNLREAEREARTAINLRPAYATAHQWLAEVLRSQRRPAEAMTSVQRALALDPLSPSLLNVHVAVLFSLGRFDEGVSAAQDLQRLYPHFPNGYTIELHHYLMARRFSDAFTTLERASVLPAARRDAFRVMIKAAARLQTGDTTHAEYRSAVALVEQMRATQPRLAARYNYMLGRNAHVADAVELAFAERRDPQLVNDLPIFMELPDPRVRAVWQATMDGQTELQ